MSRAEYLSQAPAVPERVAAPASRRTAIRLAAVAVGVGVAVALAGCGTGQVSQTAQQQSVVNGASADVGDIAIRDAQLSGPRNAGYYYSYGSDAPLVLSIINSGSQDDRLVSVTSSLAKRVKVTGDTQVPGDSSLRIGAGLLSGESTAPSASPSPAPGSANITLVGLQVEKLRPGKEVPVTFTFANAGEVTMNLPIATPAFNKHEAESPSVSG